MKRGLARVFAPWRMRWIASATARKAEPGCLFCRVARSRADRAHLVLARTPEALLMLNRFPYNPGHLMVAVRRHVGRFDRLNAGEREAVMRLTGLAERVLEAAYRPHGMNYGANAGRVAGAGFPGHLHLHLVPRWEGDTNFMTTVGESKVLPESLFATWTRLRRAIRALEVEPGGRARPAKRPARTSRASSSRKAGGKASTRTAAPRTARTRAARRGTTGPARPASRRRS